MIDFKYIYNIFKERIIYRFNIKNIDSGKIYLEAGSVLSEIKKYILNLITWSKNNIPLKKILTVNIFKAKSFQLTIKSSVIFVIILLVLFFCSTNRNDFRL